MTIFQLLMLGASAFFAFKIYEHIQTLKDPEQNTDTQEEQNTDSSVVRTAQSFSTSSAEKLLEKADESREKGELDRALAIYSEANIKRPHDAETLFKMGYTLVLQGRDDEALEYLLESLEYDDQNPFAYKEIAAIYEKMGEEDKARGYKLKGEALEKDL